MNQDNIKKPNYSPYYEQLAEWTEFIPESEIRRLLLVSVPYYFGGGKPGALPIDTFKQIFTQISDDMDTNGINMLNYGPTGGIKSLREVLAKRMVEKDKVYLPRGWEDVIITTGSQQILYGLLDVLLRPKDVVITARPSYLGFVAPVTKLGGDVLSVPSDMHGILPEYVEKAINLSIKELNRKPKAIYVIPDSDNPKGTTLPEKRRKELYNLAETYKILIIEDSAYREIQFVDPLPTIKSYDKENEYVAYLRTSSKEAAVLRLGYSALPEILMNNMLKVKGYLDLCTPTLTQNILEIYYSKYIDRVLGENLKIYKKRCDTMRKMIDQHFPTVGTRSDPTGGFFFWYMINGNIPFNSKTFLEEKAIPNEVLYVPGVAFYPLKGHSVSNRSPDLEDNRIKNNGMRLSFSFTTTDVIEEGMEKLGKLLCDEVK